MKKAMLLQAQPNSPTSVVLKQAATSLRLLAFQLKQLYEIEQRAKAKADTALANQVAIAIQERLQAACDILEAIIYPFLSVESLNLNGSDLKRMDSASVRHLVRLTALHLIEKWQVTKSTDKWVLTRGYLKLCLQDTLRKCWDLDDARSYARPERSRCDRLDE